MLLKYVGLILWQAQLFKLRGAAISDNNFG